jgi:hypothetical protein
MRQFCAKFASHVIAGDVDAGIVVVNNGTDTQWFRLLSDVASAFCFLYRRCFFWTPTDADTESALQGQVLVYAGDDVAGFVARFADVACA